MADITTHTIRIIDYRQSKKPNFLLTLVGWTVPPSGLFWPGILAGSEAMQWAGFFMFLIMSFVYGGLYVDAFKTPDEARKMIDEIEKR